MSILAGIPPLLNGINSVFGKAIQVQALANFISKQFFLNKKVLWGIYLPSKKKAQARLILEADGFLDFEIQNSSQVAGYRIEQGKFAHYNKVDSPYITSLVMVKTGDEETLRDFLLSLDTISNDICLYDIVTPEQVYSNANVLRYSYKRNAQEGFNTLYINLVFLQILSVSEAQFNKPTETVSGQRPESIGTQVAK